METIETKKLNATLVSTTRWSKTKTTTTHKREFPNLRDAEMELERIQNQLENDEDVYCNAWFAGEEVLIERTNPHQLVMTTPTFMWIIEII